MRFIPADEVELELPDSWNQTVAAAEKYVEDKVKEAREQALAEGASPGELENVERRARATAINAKSAVWSEAGRVLCKVMHEKCWYCESDEDRSDMPVDHFRPKNKVAKCPDHPGYWWLAFDWTNYRYSCTFCNSRRVAVETAGGKQDHFPLLNPDQRAFVPSDDLGHEAPELLDPCNIDDPKLLTFLETGQAWEACQDETKDEFRRAHTSIELYHLDHIKAKRSRKALAIQIKRKVKRIDSLENQDPRTPAVSSEIKEVKKELISMVRERRAYCTAARIYLRAFQGVPWVLDILERDI